MLSMLTRKLCPLMTLAMATVGCGKKIADTKTEPASNTQNSETSSAYILRLDGSLMSSKKYYMPGHGQFKVPESLRVLKGQTAGRTVEITYDVNEYDTEDFQFKCSYVSSSNPAEMHLDKCVDYDNDDFGDVSEQIFSIYQYDIIQLKFIGAPASDLVVDAIYSIKWI